LDCEALLRGNDSRGIGHYLLRSGTLPFT